MLLCIVYAMLFVDSVDIYRDNFWGGSLCCCMQDAACIDSVNIPWILWNLHCVENVSTALTYIPLNALEILMPSVNIYSMVEKLSVPAFQNFLWIENRLNIKKVMGRNV